MFPTRVGMNRIRHGWMNWLQSVPHSRGDEPLTASAHGSVILCSPLAWG